MRTRLLATAAGCAVVLSADVVVAVARAGDQPARRPAAVASSPAPVATTPAPKPKPKPKPPPRLLLDVAPPGSTTHKVLSMTLSGTGVRTERRPAEPAFAVRAGHVVTADTLAYNEYTGCGIAGCSRNSYSEIGIVVRDMTGGSRRVLTKGGYDREPSFSPDGTEVAYLAHVVRNNRENDVIVTMSASGRPHNVFAAPADGTYSAPMWSPDGRFIAAVEQPNDTRVLPNIVLVPVGGGPQRRIARGRFDALRWSPDSKLLVARGVVLGPDDVTTGRDLWVVPVGGVARRITHLAPKVRQDYTGAYCGSYVNDLGVGDAVVTPDGKHVVFTTNTPYRARAGQGWDVVTIGVDGSGTRTVWHGPAPSCGGYNQLRSTYVRPIGWL